MNELHEVAVASNFLIFYITIIYDSIYTSNGWAFLDFLMYSRKLAPPVQASPPVPVQSSSFLICLESAA
ncbi:hypothetical protein VNO80_24272 [Phaseolus coccineus]|uniref:Uncharacterized protein n=1 Tax=Phaseolus coccineus TaxID=3886 RepID=A0AAN9QKW7_PHACN